MSDFIYKSKLAVAVLVSNVRLGKIASSLSCNWSFILHSGKLFTNSLALFISAESLEPSALTTASSAFLNRGSSTSKLIIEILPKSVVTVIS